MSRKLFVGGLSWNTTDEGLKEAFSRFGVVVEAKVVTDRETGRSRGFGFVSYSEATDGEAARQAMDGASLDGRSIRVNAAEDKPRTGGGGGGGGPRGGGALLIGGIVKLILHKRQNQRDVAFWTDPRGAGIIVRMRF